MAQSVLMPGKYSGSQAGNIWPGTDMVWQKQFNALPAFIEFRDGMEPEVNTFFTYLQKKFQLPAAITFQPISIESDDLNWRHVKYQMQVSGVPVFNGIFVLHLYNDRVKKYNGYVFTNISVPTVPTVNQPDALHYALAEVGAQEYKWELPQEEQFLKKETGDELATFYPKGELMILQIGSNTATVFKLVWRFDVYAQQPMGRWYVYVDANNGEIVKKTSRICTANTTGTAVTAYRGNRSIVADSYNGSYRLRETTRGQGIRTYNMLQGTSYGNSVDFTDADNYWNNVNANKDQYAGDAHWGAEMTYDFYQSMGRNSIDNNGFALNLYVHYNTNYVNAFWDGTRMTFGDGNSSYHPLTSLDVTGHEISHGLDEHTANLDYQDEAGALNESFSDIFGTCVEWFADSTKGNWLMAEDLGSPFRSMSNPNTYGDPDTYQGTYWYSGTGDYGGVHTNSGVQNHWFYRLCMGGSGTNDLGNTFNVSGLGLNKAKQIAWRNMVYYLTNTADYTDARFYAIQSANDIYGACSPEAISTTKAWYAVGVGADFTGGADAQFTLSSASGCSAPFTVSFTNGSSNSNSYSWDFGDGATSTILNPTHTYNSFGNYTVRLVANGGICGTDSLVVPNAVSVQSTNPCIVILPTNGTYQTQTSCAGTIYDDGGPNGIYSNNSNSMVTIAPPGAASVTLHFSGFGMESTYDFLYVYDGPSTASPVIGSYSGNTIPANITSSGPAITIRQYSDVYVVDSGFAISWMCNQPSSPPVANFKADVTQSCSGNIHFTDLTTGGVYGWLWNFGDGTTSNLQHPSHSYTGNGTYTVSLTATNGFGSNTVTKNNYITVNKPSGPVVAAPSSCGPSAFTLTANGGDSITWYNPSGNAVYQGNPFHTPIINSSTTYYAEEKITQPSYYAGPADNTIGGGAIFTNPARSLVFDVFKNSTLVSVLVYAQGDGFRTVQYRDSAGGVIAEKTVFIPNGESRITLNLPLTPGTSYQLGVRDTLNLFRNSSGAIFPYNDANGMVSITGTDATSAPNYYYFFYDWEVREQACISERTPVAVSIHPIPTVTGTATNVTCNGLNNGSISAIASGGSGSYTYHWNTGQSIDPISGLSAGTYSVTANDIHNCTATASFQLTEPATLTAVGVSTPDTCNRTVGSVLVNASGGTGNYNYYWNTGTATANEQNLAAGIYEVTVVDQNNCSVSADATVTNDGSLSVSITSTDAQCHGNMDGMVQAAVNLGTAPLLYFWSTGDTTSTLSNLSSGNYEVSISDANGCSTVATAVVHEPAALNVSAAITNVTCYGAANGTAVLAVSGGTPAYVFTWGNSVVPAALVAGTYDVTVSDSHQCTVSETVTITQPDEIQFATASTDATAGENNGSITVSNVSGGSAPYSYQWNTGDTTNPFVNLAPGSFTVSVTDNNGCVKTASVVVGQTTGIENPKVAQSFQLYPNPTSGKIILAVNEVLPETNIGLRNMLGQLLLSANVTATQTALDLSYLPSGVYFMELYKGETVKSTLRFVVKK